MSEPANTATLPLAVRNTTIGGDHINALGHLEAGTYVTLFETAIAPFFSRIGLTDERLLHTAANGTVLSPFLVEMHVSYFAELNPGDSVGIAAQLLDHDVRRARLMLTMTKHPHGRPAAACELLILNMDTVTRKPAAWSTTQAAAWQTLIRDQGLGPMPSHAGRAIGALKPA